VKEHFFSSSHVSPAKHAPAAAAELAAGRAHAAPAGEDAVVGDSKRLALRTEGYFLVKPDCLCVLPSTVAALVRSCLLRGGAAAPPSRARIARVTCSRLLCPLVPTTVRPLALALRSPLSACARPQVVGRAPSARASTDPASPRRPPGRPCRAASRAREWWRRRGLLTNWLDSAQLRPAVGEFIRGLHALLRRRPVSSNSRTKLWCGVILTGRPNPPYGWREPC